MINHDKNLVLIGMSGCGKSTLGNMLSKKLNMDFLDTDKFIEEKEGKSISELFLKGEDYFRKIEKNAIANISENKGKIISTGGGVIKIQENMVNLSKNSIIFFIDRPVEKIMDSLEDSNRPLLKNNKGNLYKMYEERYPLYIKYCDYHIINEGYESEAIDKILDIYFKM